MNIIGIDPGTRESAWVLYDPETKDVGQHQIESNETLLVRIRKREAPFNLATAAATVLEEVYMGGMAAGVETFETVFWTGRFVEALDGHGAPWSRMRRHVVKVQLCGNTRANDANIRQALLDRFGGAAAVGKRKTPGPLYGITSHKWAALALAVAQADRTVKGHGVDLTPVFAS